MKGRVISGLWIIAALCLFYLGWDGEFFTALLFCCCGIALAEIWIVAFYENFRMPAQPKFPFAWASEFLILCLAMLTLITMGRDEAALVVLVCILSDVGAFAFGKIWGKHRVEALKEISPNKTQEGFVGGIIIAIIVGVVTCELLGIAFTHGVVVFIALSGPISEIGDILGSAAKRQLGIKDSGEVLRNYSIFKWLEWPLKGHGGYLDRMDSISLGIVVFAIINFAL